MCVMCLSDAEMHKISLHEYSRHESSIYFRAIEIFRHFIAVIFVDCLMCGDGKCHWQPIKIIVNVNGYPNSPNPYMTTHITHIILKCGWKSQFYIIDKRYIPWHRSWINDVSNWTLVFASIGQSEMDGGSVKMMKIGWIQNRISFGKNFTSNACNVKHNIFLYAANLHR